MKLVIAIIQDKDAPRILESLTKSGFSATKLASTGGFLHDGNTTLLIGVEDEHAGLVHEQIGRLAKSRHKLVTPIAPVGGAMDTYVPYPVEVVVGGATIFTLPVERFERF